MKRLFLASLAVAAMFASCEKEVVMDPAVTGGQAMKFAPYAGANSTRGAAINSNSAFETAREFKVSAYNGDVQYFDFETVEYDAGAWESTTTHYWPVDDVTLHFGAYYPTTAGVFDAAPAFSNDGTDNSLTFGYTAPETIASQQDVMYAITDTKYSDNAGEVGLHFKHALTQIAFTATKDASLTVTVNSIQICNVVNNGDFEAALNTNGGNTINTEQGATAATPTTEAIWTVPAGIAQAATPVTDTKMFNYATKVAAAVTVDQPKNSATPNAISDDTDVLMLLPQTLTAWNPGGSYTEADYGVAYGTDSYLAVGCSISVDGKAIVTNGTVYVPFSTAGIKYDGVTETNGWKPGYKLTYNLHFGGGYSIPANPADPDGDPTTDPDPKPEDEPGIVPDPDITVPTIRPITYSVSVDAWVPVEGGTVKL